MLLSKSMRITPTLVSATAARISGPSVVANLDQHRNLVLTNAIIQNGLTGKSCVPECNWFAVFIDNL